MDQDSERQFDWENNIRISYEGYEDDIIQKVEAGNISLSLPSTKYVTFSGKTQGLFGIKSISKLGPVDVTTIASIEKSKKESEWEGGGQSSTQQKSEMWIGLKTVTFLFILGFELEWILFQCQQRFLFHHFIL